MPNCSAMFVRLFALALIAVLGLSRPAHADARDRAFRAEMYDVIRKLRAEHTQPGAQVVLVTMGIGNLIWERHGHIALCVLYDNPDDDACYNYGIANFHAPIGMTWGFFRGTRSFWVGKLAPDEMLQIYVYYDRTIWAQPLQLDPPAVKQVIDKLEYDIQEDHKYYAYDHFDDNCTTRVRDIIDKATNGALSAMKEPVDGRTYRDLAREGFYSMKVPLLITDIAMGRSTDRVPDFYQRMFLPQYLREAVHKKWGIDAVVLYERHGPPASNDDASGRFLFALVILLLTAPVWATRLWRRFERAGLWVALVPQLVLGSALWFFAIISPLPYVRGNETCLVLLPADILLALLPPARARLYARGRVVMLALLALLDLVGLLHQPLLAPILWPLVPNAVIAFWPERQQAAAAAAKDKPEATSPARETRAARARRG